MSKRPATEEEEIPAKKLKEDEDSDEEVEDLDEFAQDDVVPQEEITYSRFTIRDLLKHMTPEQEDRYEKFRRSKFQKKAVKQVMRGAVNVPVNETTAIVMIGIAKVFVGEVVESGICWLTEARSIMDEQGDVGPLRPTHIREALRRMDKAKKHVQL